MTQRESSIGAVAPLTWPDVEKWQSWSQLNALPLWATAGYDRQRHVYHERLSFDALPVNPPALRVMVQSRQIATYARATLDGVVDASEAVYASIAEMQRRYWRSDAEKGWVFSVAADGRPYDKTRDLYAHAFVLYALSCVYSLSRDPYFLRVARETVSELGDIFASPYGGFVDAVPASDPFRRQNPHMHLLEAFLALASSTQDSFFLEQAQRLMALAETKFVDPHSGLLLEIFDESWTPCTGVNRVAVEPGHLFEWSWLLNEAVRLDPGCAQNKRHREVSARLYKVGLTHGLVDGLVCDGVGEDGRLLKNTTRIWPQTELIRLLAEKGSARTKAEAKLLVGLSNAFFQRFAPLHLGGGWVDRLDADGRPAVDHMPASSLYHIYGAARVFFGKPTRPF